MKKRVKFVEDDESPSMEVAEREGRGKGLQKSVGKIEIIDPERQRRISIILPGGEKSLTTYVMSSSSS